MVEQGGSRDFAVDKNGKGKRQDSESVLFKESSADEVEFI